MNFSTNQQQEYVAYYRVSTKRQGDSGLGLEAQHTYIDHFYKGRNIIAEFTDVRSGKNMHNRPQLQAALQLCKQRKATLVIAKVDRLSRDTEQALSIFRELEERLESCDIPNLDKFSLTLFMAIADRECELASIRTRVALIQKVHRVGQWRKGSAPFRSGQASRQGTASIQQTARQNTNSRQATAQICHLITDGNSFQEIARRLNADGFRAPRGGKYSAVQVQRLCARITDSRLVDEPAVCLLFLQIIFRYRLPFLLAAFPVEYLQYIFWTARSQCHRFSFSNVFK